MTDHQAEAMLCPSCGHENREGASFCEGCGAALQLACPVCGADLRSSARFCDSCGHPVAEPPAAAAVPDPRSYTPDLLAEKILAARSAVEGERKHVTVLFAGVKGHMDLAERAPSPRNAGRTTRADRPRREVRRRPWNPAPVPAQIRS